MKFSTLFAYGMVVVVLFWAVSLGAYNHFIGYDVLDKEAGAQLESISRSKANRISSFLDYRKADSVFISKLSEVMLAFDNELLARLDEVQDKIRIRTLNLSLKFDENIDTIDFSGNDLKNNLLFSNLYNESLEWNERGFVYSLDKKMFGSVFDKNQNGTILKDSLEIINTYINDDGKEELWGTYVYTINGIEKDMYFHSVSLDFSFDGKKLYFALSVPFSDYKDSLDVVYSSEKRLRLFKDSKDYADLILINPEGDLVWTAERLDDLGTNLIKGPYNNTNLAKLYRRTRDSLGVGVSDPGYYEASGYIAIFITAPITRLNQSTGKYDLVGFVALQMKNSKIEELINEDTGISELGEVYVLNRDGNHITPLKYSGNPSDVLTGYSVDTEQYRNCFFDYDNYYLAQRGEPFEEVEKSGIFKNYAGDTVFSAYQYILESGWCVFSEISREKFYETRVSLWEQWIGDLFYESTSVFLFGFMLCFFIDKVISIKRKERGLRK